MNSNPADAEPVSPAGKTWSLRTRVLVSALLLFQVSAVLYGPLSFPQTVTTDHLRWLFRPYTGMTYQGNSYKFFSPDPGPSHLIRYELVDDKGEKRSGIFPNLDDSEEWPRLLYHRHFMLTEHLNMVGITAPDANETAPPPEWTQAKLTPPEQRIATSYADHLLHKYHGASVTLWLVRHAIPTPDQAIKGMKLTDRSLYRERRLGNFVANP
jgi:hypothetical protein